MISDLSNDSKKAFEKAIECLRNNLGVSVSTIRLGRLANMFDSWAAMMKDGKTTSTSMGKIFSDTEKPINPYFQFGKSLLCLQKRHTLPAILLAFIERFKTNDPDKLIEEAQIVKEQLNTFLGSYYKLSIKKEIL